MEGGAIGVVASVVGGRQIGSRCPDIAGCGAAAATGSGQKHRSLDFHLDPFINGIAVAKCSGIALIVDADRQGRSRRMRVLVGE